MLDPLPDTSSSDSPENPLYHALLAGRARGDGRLLVTDAGEPVGDEAFFALAARLCGVLVEAGVQPGDRVAAQVDKSWQALALYVACVRSGSVFLPLNIAYTTAELEYFVSDAEPTLIVVAPERAAMAKELPGRARVLTLGAHGDGSLMAFAGRIDTIDLPPVVAREEGDLAAILYTSGTTGRSKGAMMTQGNLLSNALTLVDAWAFEPADVLLHALPIFHTHGLFVACHTVLISGASMRFHARLDVDRLIEDLPKITVLMGVPTFYTRLLDDARFDRARVDHMRLFVSGSAPMLAATHEAFEQRTGQRVLERYGMTETNMICSNPYVGERRAGTVGPPLPGVQIRLRDERAGTVVEPADGVVGTIEVRGPNVFEGYWRMPGKTREELGEDGFFLTGDLASIDGDGYVTIVGRGKDLIITGGYNVYPKEIEQAIDALPGVLESAVVGVPHPDLGECPVAFLVARPGSMPGSMPEPQAVLDALEDRLARYKRPRRIFLIEALPRNTMGKVQKGVLRKQALTR